MSSMRPSRHLVVAGTVYRLKGNRSPSIVGKVFNDEIREKLKNDHELAKRLMALTIERDKIHTTLPFATWPRRTFFSSPHIDLNRLGHNMLGFSMRSAARDNVPGRHHRP